MKKSINNPAGWFLREDFNPEPIESLSSKYNRSIKKIIEEMKEAGNFFDSKNKAVTASTKIKEMLCLNNQESP